MVTVRREKDSMGAIEVPADKLWGAQTQRSLEHFRISTEKMPVSLIHALALTKRAAAKVNQDLGLLAAEKASAIIQAADEVLAGKHADEFPLAIWQTGSGTQSNMNMNEVLANRASEILGGVRGMERKVHRFLARFANTSFIFMSPGYPDPDAWRKTHRHSRQRLHQPQIFYFLPTWLTFTAAL